VSLDLGPAIRAAILDQQVPALQPIAQAIAAALGRYSGAPAVFAYRPIPTDAPQRVLVINEDAAISDADALTSDRPIIQRDVIAYGLRGSPGDAGDDSPAIEAMGYQLRELFHRQKFSVRPEGYSVIQIIVTGPVPAPVDDDGEIARMVSLTISLRRNP
jgi:hypothetical protein